ncbi:MAG: Gfo/Idh/MocA family oxidoreductase [Vulcanimicrobiaceae bacterium]
MVNPRVAIVGCGLIGNKRARVLAPGSLVVACDADLERAARLASPYGAEGTTDWLSVVARRDVDVVIVATSHDALAEITARAAANGKDVLVEKPAARKAAELSAVRDAVARTGAKVRVGFNHRYHRAFRRAREIVDAGALGALTHVRGRYGHGGRLGYEKEWRFVPEISGGGEAIDQGMHLVDLARWFLGDFSVVAGAAPRYFWESPVEDNAFFLLRTQTDQVAMLHASWTEWKNLFSFEIFGRTGKLEITGLGGSYGLERLAHYAMTPELGPPPTTIYEYPMADDSWEAEYAAFLEDIRLDRAPAPGFEDAAAALTIVERLYAMERSNS